MSIAWEKVIEETIAIILAGAVLAIILPVGYFLILWVVERWEDFVSWFYGDVLWQERVVPLGGRLFGTELKSDGQKVWLNAEVESRDCEIVYVGMGGAEGILNKPSAYITIKRKGKAIAQIKIPEGQSKIHDGVKIRVKSIFKQKDSPDCSAVISLYLTHRFPRKLTALMDALIKKVKQLS